MVLPNTVITIPADALDGGYTTIPPFYALAFEADGVWAKGTTLSLTATSVDGTETDTIVITIPQNTTQDTIVDLIVTLINATGPQGQGFAKQGFNAVIVGGFLFVARREFNSSPVSIFTDVTITAP
jgi:hypothetical protein